MLGRPFLLADREVSQSILEVLSFLWLVRLRPVDLHPCCRFAGKITDGAAVLSVFNIFAVFKLVVPYGVGVEISETFPSIPVGSVVLPLD